MARSRVFRVGVLLLGAGLVVTLGALSLRTLRTPAAPADRWPSTPASLRHTGGPAYTASSQVLFDVDSATLRPEATPALRAIVAKIGARNPGAVIGVEGHTDDTGPDDHNSLLSHERAARVADWLVDEAGIPRDRIKVFAMGSRFPAVPNDTPAHRQANRRVVIAPES